MAGIRIHHPLLRSCILKIPHPGDPTTGRRPKDYNIHLDSEGDSIVSETVWMRIEQARQSGLSGHEFIIMNVVENPPPIVMGENAPARQVQIFHQLPDRVTTTDLLGVAQQFAPEGIKARLTTDKDS